MVCSRTSLPSLAVVTAALVLSSTAVAQESAFSIDAATVAVDLKHSSSVYTKVKLTDGVTTITADRATVRGDSVENGQCVLDGNVQLKGRAVTIWAVSAILAFSGGKLLSGDLIGNPAELHGSAGKNIVQGEAHRISYDNSQRLARMSGDAWFKFRGDEFRCDWTYNLNAGLVQGFGENGKSCTGILRTH